MFRFLFLAAAFPTAASFPAPFRVGVLLRAVRVPFLIKLRIRCHAGFSCVAACSKQELAVQDGRQHPFVVAFCRQHLNRPCVKEEPIFGLNGGYLNNMGGGGGGGGGSGDGNNGGDGNGDSVDGRWMGKSCAA